MNRRRDLYLSLSSLNRDEKAHGSPKLRCTCQSYRGLSTFYVTRQASLSPQPFSRSQIRILFIWQRQKSRRLKFFDHKIQSRRRYRSLPR